ncbi:hypothetical protein [Cetobacterium sp.]
MFILDKEKKEEWKKYYKLQEEVFDFIFKNSEVITDNRSSKYIRTINYVEDKEKLKMIKRKINKLAKEYKEVSGKERLPYNFPIILNDVENININTNTAVQSFSITRKEENNRQYFKPLKEFKREFNFDVEKINEVMKKYKLEIERKEIDLEDDEEDEKTIVESVYITYKNLLDLAGADVIQVHIPNGIEYILTIRKIGETRSKKQRYGFIILDNLATVQYSTKQAKRSHSYEKTLEKFEFSFETVATYYIKEKKSNQMNMF